MVDSPTNMKGIKKNFYSYRDHASTHALWAFLYEQKFLFCNALHTSWRFLVMPVVHVEESTVQRQQGITETLHTTIHTPNK